MIKKLLSTELLDINCLRNNGDMESWSPAIISQLDDDDDEDEDDGDNDYQGYFRSTPLFEAAANGHTDAVRLLLDRGANPDRLSLSDNPNEFGHCALLVAVGMRHNEVVKVLIDGGPNVNM